MRKIGITGPAAKADYLSLLYKITNLYKNGIVF